MNDEYPDYFSESSSRKPKPQLYMGMTGTQIGILAGLGLVALLTMCAMAWMIFSTSLPASVPVTNPPPPAGPSKTPFVFPATYTPEATAGMEPTEMSMPEGTLVPPGDYVKFEGSGAVIWLPDSFVGGDVVKHKSDVIKKIRKLGPMFANVADDLKGKLPSELVLLMIDSTSDVTLIITSVMVRHKTMESDTPLQEYVDTEFSLTTPMPTINATKKLTILGLEARRIVSQQHNGTLEFTDVEYFIKDGNEMWSISYSLAPAEYMQMLPFVEDSIKTFYLVK